MCGIAGIWNRDGQPVDPARLAVMGSLLRHRGPDDGGQEVRGDCGLVHRRLRIIDLSGQGRQPMRTPDGACWIVFNGEIHNYLELRAEMESAGDVFGSRTDTEVALHAWARWGIEAFDRFNGMWAAALWQPGPRRLVLCRDRFGIKPLVYSERGARLAFASEPKAIVEVFPEERTPDPQEIRDYLTGGYPDMEGATFFPGIRQVPPGRAIVFTERDARSRRYWRFEPGREEPRPDAAEEFRARFEDAVRLRLRSDVPVGIALSGGLDSSAVAACARGSGGPMHAFSVRYDDPEIDESRYAALAAGADGRFTMHWVRPDPADFLAVARNITWHHDGPAPARGRYPRWFVMREAAPHVTVILTGEGSDEMLGGYTRFFPAHLLEVMAGRGPVAALREWRALRGVFTGGGWTLRRMLSGHLARRAGVEPWPFARPLGRAFAAATRPVRPDRMSDYAPSSGPYRSRLNNALWFDFFRAGLLEVLHGNDAGSMAFSLEDRAPFLDHRLVELCFSLPADEKIAGGRTKRLLRRALGDLLPAEVRDRTPKLGFPAPIMPWLREPARTRAVRELLLDGSAARRGILDRPALERMLRRALDPDRRRWGPGLTLEAVWRWISLEWWLREMVDRPPSAGQSAADAGARLGRR